MTSEEHICFRESDGWLIVEVLTVEWESHTPREVWREHHRIPASVRVSDSQRREIKKTVLADKEWFRCCRDCGALDVVGMFADDVCHPCAERRGIIF